MPRKKEEPPTVTEQLKDQIRAAGQTLNQLSKASGVAPSQLYRFMNGERSLTGDAIDKICRTLRLQLTPMPPAESPDKGPKARRPKPEEE
jgi:transcriptional regulator with XRE-family HTH domain